MIQLKIPYVKEEFYSSQMSDYIDTIVSNADSYRDLDEKLKYIRQKLSWKNLFSVIVTDMNGIRLDLYKRERIHQQSRYLRYEEAVGSTGQSQGIYIQFLIAVINYISAIYSGDSQPSEGKKGYLYRQSFWRCERYIYMGTDFLNSLKPTTCR